MSSNRLIFRVDAAPQLGAGHAMRCLALAQAWRAAGGAATFASAAMPPTLRERLAGEGAEVVALPTSATARDEARRVARLAHEREAAWIVVDGYGFDDAYEQVLHAAGLRVLALDDYGHARHGFATAVLNQNLAPAEGSYPSYAAPRQLLGREYVLLRREFRRPSPRRAAAERPASRILVTLGGSDPTNVTRTVVEALVAEPAAEREVTVVVGAGYAQADALRRRVESRPGWSLLVDAADMASPMDRADVAVSAAGGTLWELAHRGVPTLSITTADNQRVVAEACRRAGMSIDLGAPDAGLADRLRTALAELRRDPARLRPMSDRGRRLIDGRGAERVVETLRSYAA